MRCSPNYSNFSEHIEGSIKAGACAESSYGVLHLLELFDSQKSPQEPKNMNLKKTIMCVRHEDYIYANIQFKFQANLSRIEGDITV